MKYSVVIPTRDREELLKQCVDSVHRSLTADAELIIIRDLGKSEARNAGIAKARGDIIAFIDDDCIADAQWLSKLLSAFHDPDVDVAYGMTQYQPGKYGGRFPERVVQNYGRWPGAGNIAYRKKVFEQVGGFDPKFDIYNNEDTEMAIRAAAHGFCFRAVPEAIVIHQSSYWTATALRRSAHNSLAWPLLQKRYPNHWDAFGGPPHHYLIQFLLILAKWIMFPMFRIRHMVK